MIRVRLFGKFSELVADTQGMLLPPEGIATVADIVAQIADSNPGLHAEITGPQVLVAVNQQIVSRDTAVASGDEVAFLPPVTGG
jgi:molybdopterin synthase sulfur carrier subunit